jgi:hypothetical protein
MLETLNYSQPLRAIGQALELLNIESFEILPDGEDFLVRGKPAVSLQDSIEQPIEPSKLRHIWGFLPDRKESGTNPTLRSTAVTELDLRYTPRDVDRLESEGQSKRVDSRRAADAASLSQFLRTVGAYVDQKYARLLRICRKGDTVVLNYELSSGRGSEEVLSASDLYDFWVRMYMRRADRNAV